MNSERAEQVYFLHSRYSEPKWFLYEREGSYPHMENLITALMYEKDKITVNGTEINISYEIKMAISTVKFYTGKQRKLRIICGIAKKLEIQLLQLICI